MHKIVKCMFKHLLCSIVNKILAHVVWNSFSFHFIQINKKMAQHFRNSGCISEKQMRYKRNLICDFLWKMNCMQKSLFDILLISSLSMRNIEILWVFYLWDVTTMSETMSEIWMYFTCYLKKWNAIHHHSFLKVAHLSFICFCSFSLFCCLLVLQSLFLPPDTLSLCFSREYSTEPKGLLFTAPSRH